MASQRSINRILVNVALDGVFAAAAAPVARLVADPAGGLLHPLWFLAGGGITLLLGGVPFRLSQQYWRFSGIADLAGVVGGSVVSAALFACVFLATGFALPTVTFPVVHALVLMVFLGAPRILYRLYQGRARAGHPTETTLLVGAGEPADSFMRAVAADRRGGIAVAGLLAMTDRQAGRRMHNQPILGTVDQAGPVLERLRARGRLPATLVITEADFLGPPLAALITTAERLGVQVRRAPRASALQSADSLALRPVAIEDLLNRPQVGLDPAGMARLIEGRRVLVTGAGGTIGAELSRQVAGFGPAALTLLDSSEYALWQIDLEIGELHPALDRRAVIADVRDAPRIAEVFAQSRPELVFHAAALKHVPMVEANPLEGLMTNAVGTAVVADAASAVGVTAMVLISTDKAVNPSSLMGASKRLAEIYVQALEAQGRLRCVTVRFGNVLGSTGSVVPLFRRQLERGGPLTVTHPDMQRYFMTVREAVSLVLQASVLGVGAGAFGQGIVVLDMGEPVKIVDLARQMITLAGLRPGVDVEIRYTGLRPGEKLFEELFHGHEPPSPTGHPGLLLATPRRADLATIRPAFDRLAALCREGQVEAAERLVQSMVPEFSRPHAEAPAPAFSEG